MRLALSRVSKLFFLLLVLVSVIGCVAVSVSSNKSPDIQQKLGKLYILVGHGDVQNAYTAGLIKAVQEAFQNEPVEIKAEALSPLAL